jgi:hypothetical protein
MKIVLACILLLVLVLTFEVISVEGVLLRNALLSGFLGFGTRSSINITASAHPTAVSTSKPSHFSPYNSWIGSYFPSKQWSKYGHLSPYQRLATTPLYYLSSPMGFAYIQSDMQVT